MSLISIAPHAPEVTHKTQSTMSTLGPFPATPTTKPFTKYINIDQLEVEPVQTEQELKQLEHKIITMQGHCPTDIINDLRVRIFQLDPALINKFSGMTGMYDANYQDGMGCLIDAMISEQDSIPDLRLRRWITNITRIGKPSTHASAFTLSSNYYPLYVVKITNDADHDNLAHEAIIGMAAINKLRYKIPNFMHTYGAFMCAPPVVNKRDEVVAWCPSHNNPVTYLVLENIQGATSLEALAPKLNDSEFLQIYLQVLNAINIAYEEFNFTHYDLHAGNILVQILPYYVSIPLYLEKGTLYIKTRFLARIIDYGASHITIRRQHFGLYDYEKFGIFPDRTFPITDAYKLLLFTYYWSTRSTQDDAIYVLKTHSSLKSVANRLYGFFGEPHTLDKRIELQNNNRRGDYFQGSLSIAIFKLSEFINFILANFELPFISATPPTDAVTTICTDNCVTWDGFVQHIFNQSRLPETLEDYCQAITAVDALAGLDIKVSIRTWLHQFNIDIAYTNEAQKYVTLLNSCIMDLSSFTIHSDDYGLYEIALTNYIDIKHRFTELDIWVASAECAFTMENKMPAIAIEITKIRNTIYTLKENWFAIKDAIMEKGVDASMIGSPTIKSLIKIIRLLTK